MALPWLVLFAEIASFDSPFYHSRVLNLTEFFGMYSLQKDDHVANIA